MSSTKITKYDLDDNVFEGVALESSVQQVKTLVETVKTDGAKESSVQEIKSMINNNGSSPFFMEYVFDIDKKIANICNVSGYSTDYSHRVFIINGEAHILSSTTYSSKTYYYHHKWDGRTLTLINTELPYSPNACYCLYRNEIHCVYCSSGGSPTHYKFNGTTWEQLTNTSFTFVNRVYYNSYAIEYNGKMHVYTCADDGDHYSWDGNTWATEGTINISTPVAFFLKSDGMLYAINEEGVLYQQTSDNNFISLGVDEDFSSVYNTLGYPCVDDNDIMYLHTISDNSKYLYRWNGGATVECNPYLRNDIDSIFVFNGVCYYISDGYIYQFTYPAIKGYMIKGTKIFSNEFYKGDGWFICSPENIEFISNDCAVVIENGETIVEFTTDTPTYVIA